MNKVCTVKVQHTLTGRLLGACIALSAEDIGFVDSTTQILEVRKKQIYDGLILEIRGVNHDSGNR